MNFLPLLSDHICPPIMFTNETYVYYDHIVQSPHNTCFLGVHSKARAKFANH